MENDKISVSLGLDIDNFEGNIQDALKLFDKFQKNFEEEFELKIDTSKISKIALKELDDLQKKLERMKDKSYELRIKAKYADTELLNAVKDEKMTYGRRGEVEKAHKRTLKAQENVESIAAELRFNDRDIANIQQQVSELFGDLLNISELDFENIKNVDLLTEARSIKASAENAEKLKDNVEETKDEVEETTDRTTFLGTVFARLGKQIKRQMYTSVASLLNPINNFKKVFSYLTDTLSPRLGATFKNIGNNLTEYFASSNFFQNLIHWALYFVYILQTIYNTIAKIFGWRNIDLFKKSARTAKELEKSASKTTASFDEINDIGNQNNTMDQTPLGAGELFSAEEMNKATDIASKFEGVVERVKQDIDNIKKYWKEILAVVIIVASVIGLIKLADLFSGAKGEDGGITNLTGLADGVGKLASKAGDALVIISVLGGISLALTALADVLTVIDGMTGDVKGKMNGLAIIVGSLSVLVLALAAAATLCSSPLAMAGLAEITLALSAILLVMEATLPTILDATGKFIEKVAPPTISLLTTIRDVIQVIIKQLGESLPPIIQSIGSLFNTIFTNISKLVKTVGDTVVNILNAVSSTVSSVFTSILNFINELGPAVNNCVDGIIQAVTKVINFFVSGIEYLINTIIIKPINSLIKKVTNGAIGELLDWVGIPGLKTISNISVDRFVPKYDVGTNYVPNDQLAMIHKGEAIIPKEFNEKTYFGNNDETNSLIEQLIDKIDNIDFAPYTTIKDVGKASVEYIKNTSRQLGRSVI